MSLNFKSLGKLFGKKDIQKDEDVEFDSLFESEIETNSASEEFDDVKLDDELSEDIFGDNSEDSETESKEPKERVLKYNEDGKIIIGDKEHLKEVLIGIQEDDEKFKSFNDDYDYTKLSNYSLSFIGDSKIKRIPYLNLGHIRDLSYLFSNCYDLEYIEGIKTDSNTDMKNMFYGCEKLKEIPYMNTEKVTNMEKAFHDCKKIKTIPLLNTVSVTDSESIFEGCESLEEVPELSLFSSKYRLKYTFKNCKSLKKLPSNLNIENVRDNSFYMFKGCESLENIENKKDYIGVRAEHPFILSNLSFSFNSAVNDYNITNVKEKELEIEELKEKTIKPLEVKISDLNKIIYFMELDRKNRENILNEYKNILQEHSNEMEEINSEKEHIEKLKQDREDLLTANELLKTSHSLNEKLIKENEELNKKLNEIPNKLFESNEKLINENIKKDKIIDSLMNLVYGVDSIYINYDDLTIQKPNDSKEPVQEEKKFYSKYEDNGYNYFVKQLLENEKWLSETDLKEKNQYIIGNINKYIKDIKVEDMIVYMTNRKTMLHHLIKRIKPYVNNHPELQKILLKKNHLYIQYIDNPTISMCAYVIKTQLDLNRDCNSLFRNKYFKNNIIMGYWNSCFDSKTVLDLIYKNNKNLLTVKEKTTKEDIILKKIKSMTPSQLIHSYKSKNISLNSLIEYCKEMVKNNESPYVLKTIMKENYLGMLNEKDIFLILKEVGKPTISYISNSIIQKYGSSLDEVVKNMESKLFENNKEIEEYKTTRTF